ncbi:MAG: twin-arginine translocase subunit TatC [Acidobacteria bacterium]|nr:twin-arginine translocase subunit TatC [Acidobacteriota bacterium]
MPEKINEDEVNEIEPEANEEGLQMSFLDHLDELRVRLIQSVIGVTIAFAVCFLFAKQIYYFLEIPVKQQLRKARIQDTKTKAGSLDLNQIREGETLDYTFAQETAVEGVRVPQGTTVPVKAVKQDNQLALVLERRWAVGSAIVPEGKAITTILKEGENQNTYGEEDKLILRSVTGAFTLYVQVALYTGLALVIPFLLFQVWSFVSPGLYDHEKKYITPVMIMATFFFTAGAGFAYKIAFPAACDYLLAWQTDGGFRTLLDAEDYFNLIMLIMLGLGIVFQIPTISFVLGRIGLITSGMMLKAWRHAVVGIAIIAAVFTPTPDAFNMMVFMVPMYALYFLSVGIVWIFGKKRQTDEEAMAGA